MFTKNYIISTDKRPLHKNERDGNVTSVIIEEVQTNGRKKTVYANIRYSSRSSDDTVKQLVSLNKRRAA